MTLESQCQLCSSTEGLTTFEIGHDSEVLVCSSCKSSLESNDYSNINHWRSLGEAIWHENTAVKVLSYRILHKIKSEPWALDLLEQIYLEEEDLLWAKEGIPEEHSSGSTKPTTDSNGTPLLEGDSVTIIKDLDVKGAGFTAKRGTLVKNIKLTENPEHIEGKVNGIGIVLVAKFLKKV